MTARESIRTTLLKLKNQTRREGQLRLPAAWVTLALEAGVHLLLAAALAGAVILEHCAPFAAALVGAAGPGLYGAAALVGAAAGYLSLLPFDSALRYLSAAILTFAVAFACYDLKPIRRRWAMPLITALLVGFTGFLVEGRHGLMPSAAVRLILEMVLTAAAVWCDRAALSDLQYQPCDRLNAPARQAGTLVLLATVLISLVSLPDPADLNPGRAGGFWLTLAAARQGGPAVGAAAGAALGLACDLAGEGLPLRSTLWAVTGLLAGLCREKKPRYWTAGVGAGLTVFSVLWLWGHPASLSLLYEGLAASLALLCTPEGLLRRLGLWLTPEPMGPADLRSRDLARQKLEAAAGAFRSLAGSLHTAFCVPDNDNDIASVFDRAANRACRSCALRSRCWQQDYTATFNALNDATPPMVDRGRAAREDFPDHFVQRCIRFPQFLDTVNEELTALFYRRQYQARIRESRRAVCRQYAQLSDLLGSAAAEMGLVLTEVPELDRRVRRRLAELGLEVRVALFRDSRGLLRLQGQGVDARELARASRLEDLGLLLDAPLRVEVQGPGSISLIQQEPLMAVAGIAARKKSGQTVSGDSGTYFKRADGLLYLLLCDGMGTGPEASRESSLAVELLEQFLTAGVDPCHALTTLSAALALRGEETGGFTTVDLLQLDLFTGESTLFKLGAAPTYLRQGKKISRYLGASLPAGLAEGAEASIDQFRFTLAPGDVVVMVSDGVCTAEEDDWLQQALLRFDGESPKELARSLIQEASSQPPDDRTALVIRLDHRSF